MAPTCPALGSTSGLNPPNKWEARFALVIYSQVHTFQKVELELSGRKSQNQEETVPQSLHLEVHTVADVLVTRVENSFNVLRSKVSLHMKDNPLYV